jgi:hypothetical protein
MLVADAIGLLAIRLIQLCWEIIPVVLDRVWGLRRRRLWMRADGGSFLRTLVHRCFVEVAVRWLRTTRFLGSGVGPEAI